MVCDPGQLGNKRGDRCTWIHQCLETIQNFTIAPFDCCNLSDIVLGWRKPCCLKINNNICPVFDLITFLGKWYETPFLCFSFLPPTSPQCFYTASFFCASWLYPPNQRKNQMSFSLSAPIMMINCLVQVGLWQTMQKRARSSSHTSSALAK